MSVPPNDHDPYASAPGPDGPTPADPASGSWGAAGPAPSDFPASGAWGAPGPASAGAPGPHPAGAPGSAPVPGPAPGTDLASDLGQSLRFAGLALLRNPVSYLVTGVIYSVATFLVAAIAIVTAMAVLFSQSEQWGSQSEPPPSDLLLFYAIVFGICLLMVPLMLLWQAGSARSGHVVLEGGRPRLGQTLVGPMRIIVTALLVGALTLVGTLLLYLPGLIIAVLTFYAIPAAARGASPIAAIKKSFSLATSNIGTTIVAWLVMNVISSLSGMIIIAFVIVIPFMVLFQLGMYERVEGRRLQEPARS